VIKATWLSSRNDAISTTGFALVGLAARAAPCAGRNICFDVVIAAICFQATWAIWRSVRASAARDDAQAGLRNKAQTEPAGGL
jgi:hypothetical protein